MNYYISMIIPSLIGLKFYININNLDSLNKKNFLEHIYYYLILFLLTNTFTSLFSCIFLGLNSKLEDSLNEFPMFSIKYIFISIFFTYIICIIITFIKKRVSLEVCVNVKKS